MIVVARGTMTYLCNINKFDRYYETNASRFGPFKWCARK